MHPDRFFLKYLRWKRFTAFYPKPCFFIPGRNSVNDSGIQEQEKIVKNNAQWIILFQKYRVLTVKSIHNRHLDLEIQNLIFAPFKNMYL
jgi:hypothetical protein